MLKSYYYKLFLIIAIIGIFIYLIYPVDKKIKKGLDLQGGIHIVLEVEKPPEETENINELTDRALEIIRNRIDALGVSEPIIQKEGANRIIVDIPGVKEPEKAIDIIGKTALLEFKLVNDDPKALQSALEGNPPEGYEVLYTTEKDERGIARKGSPILVKKEPELTGKYIKDAYVSYDPGGLPSVSIVFNSEGAKIFENVTTNNVGRQLAIVLDGVVKSAPMIRERIPEGKGQISGKFNMEEAKELAIVLRAGALPAKVNMIYQQIIGPTLGKKYIQQGFRVILYGGILVFIFMIFYYSLFCLFADFALALNILILLGIMAGIKGVLTMPGIAGIALTIGMSVDANILIFERIREEIKAGKSPKTAVDAGYLRAWSAILDSNITTLIIGAILFFFGEGSIKGFGLTLSIGILANLFTAVYVTKVIVDYFLIIKKVEKIRI